MCKLHAVSALSDNYVWILENDKQQAVVVDPAQADVVVDFLTKQSISPLAIILTHHHNDHIGGVLELQSHYPALSVFGPKEIPLAINQISGQSLLSIADFDFKIISVPGHTLGHVAYYCKPYLFCGDTLFSAGCGRIFEGSYQQMFESLCKLSLLPDDTQVCPAHEYTFSNLTFANHLLPYDQDISTYLNSIDKSSMTLPSSLANEKRINLFLRCDDKTLQNQFNVDNEFDLFVFLREQKNNF